MILTGLDVSDHQALQLAVGSIPSVFILADTQPRGGILHGSLAEEYPDLARQWIHESNGSHTPSSVSAGSVFLASWRCDRGCEHCGLPHEWRARVAVRSQMGTGCPFCSGQKTCRCCSLAAKHPELMEQWDWDGNQGTDPYGVGCSSHKKVSWICTEHGQWDASPAKRVKYRTDCPDCARQRSLEPRPGRGYLKDELPDVYAELHPTKNSGIDSEKLTCGSARRVWWLCRSDESRPEGCQHEHAWETQVRKRCAKLVSTGCPFCSGKRVCPCKSLAELHPDLLLYWDTGKNVHPLGEPLDPFWLGVYSIRKVWWRHECAEGRVHHWAARVGTVVRSFMARGRVPCPGCALAIRTAQSAEPHAKLIKRK